ncbi:hypothetical protein [Cytobacillus horneckiae]|uniref:Uncharacterized protein n=1 Tax=Cytobacillus horneckiae TaxID=549687 RepID=A0A2N0ZI36_9BACI|nr:hypothetical protein [Cytobacillus horneckiae]MEC1157996.1 hypothetical protein [Cytobacillus horneckiae]MED2937079.1 hypothetical protein [Cytobacillus horneckiae]PKG29170.1 hypothetical protein CWS20_10445 [Cytobacillus horneckiae]
MRINQFESPAGLFQIFINGQLSEFNISQSNYNTYFIDNVPIRCTNVYEAKIDILDLNIGDKILCEYEDGQFFNDGGGERMSNIIGEFNNYIVGMGAYDDVEVYYDYKTKIIPYVNNGHTSRGFEFEILDHLKMYKQNKNDTRITVKLVWESNKKDYAYDIVGFLTS